ncbi:allantoinase AllB [Solirubrobacter sp. CPCC 204708]|uniref:Allantoinase AllB n=1 Tax=Solirubrobacter deserti TaxID=2282478 RepID=A0ABT4RUY2_9ACTN|nr:allantoinase AllB [Solirubrobacter deserti]MBE2316245.1 allantoinase AllB [Solirubrobacter deserti]MDA0142075.1 allantoinase AllB [Solirubrobacter deserti]
MFDLVVRGGAPFDVGVSEGVIAALGRELPGGAHEIDATGLHVLPAGLDPHVHFNEPGRTHWEGLRTGSASLAAGGFSAFFDMPLNSTPPVIDGAAFDAKLEAARRESCLDFGLWGALVPGARLEELAERGVIGFKAFMSDSGIEDFARADDVTLYEGMALAAQLGLLVAVHAENDALTSRPRGPSAADWLASRPIVAELEAISRAITFATDTACSLHIVHVSSAEGVDLVTEARRRGVDVTCETCPHYLFLTAEDVDALGAVAKCAPPIRDAAQQARLWERVRAGEIDFVTSDHSPSPPEMKKGAFGDAWGGIAGGQSTLELLLGELAPEEAVRLTNAAWRFGVKGKGPLAVGADADLTLVDLNATYTLAAADLRSRHRLSPYVGRELRARVVRTLVRGQDPAPGIGRLLRPTIY